MFGLKPFDTYMVMTESMPLRGWVERFKEGEFGAEARKFLANEAMFVTSKSYFASQRQAAWASPVTN